MNFIHQQIADYFGLDPRQSLLNGIEAENDDRRVMENTDILVVPDGKNDDKVNLYESNMWNNATLAGLLRNAGVRSRSAGHALTALGLISRLRQIVENTASESAYEPTAFGRNKWEYWFPIIREMVVGVGITILTIFTVQYLYGFSEDFHQSYECSKVSNFYSLHCYVLKKCRAYLEEMNYNLVYTVICGLGLACANTLRKYQNSATKAFV
tara:strand:+ start:107 stop:739 length:633 start_codon:yes stop_codon:yes gene_type:complete